MNSGSTAVAALISGDTPITQTAGPGVVKASMNGAYTVMIAGAVVDKAEIVPDRGVTRGPTWSKLWLSAPTR